LAPGPDIPDLGLNLGFAAAGMGVDADVASNSGCDEHSPTVLFTTACDFTVEIALLNRKDVVKQAKAVFVFQKVQSEFPGGGCD
jgi:hypothetical protein